MQQREQARRHQHVMAGRDHRADAVLPLEAHRDIERDGETARIVASTPSWNSSLETLGPITCALRLV